MTKTKTAWLAAVLVASILVPGAPLYADVPEGDGVITGLLPDLISVAPEPGTQRFTLGDSEFPALQGHLLLRFDGVVSNAGDGPLHIDGNPQHSDPKDPNSHDMWQWVLQEDDTWLPAQKVPIQYETDDNHDHFHVMEIARYRLLEGDGTGAVQAGAAMKVGFCLVDSQLIPNYEGPVGERTYGFALTQYCQQHDPGAETLTMGITEGWRDLYSWSTNFQWVDVSNAPPGEYRVEHQVDPNGFVLEIDENNPPALAQEPTIIPGFNPKKVNTQTVFQQGTWVTLQSQKFVSDFIGAPEVGAPLYAIIEPPEHGTLNVQTGVPFRPSTIYYTPDPGFAGSDSFTYGVRNTKSDFPIVMPTAKANIMVTAPDGPPDLGEPPTCDGQEATIWVPGDPAGAVITGTPGDDVIVGTSGRDIIDGGGGDDLICSLDSRDIVDGGNGDDVIFAGRGNDTVVGGHGDDEAYGQGGRDKLKGKRGFDLLRGGSANDIIRGNADDDDLFGDGGDDVLAGGTGVDSLDGGNGFDTCSGVSVVNCEA